MILIKWASLDLLDKLVRLKLLSIYNLIYISFSYIKDLIYKSVLVILIYQVIIFYITLIFLIIYLTHLLLNDFF